MTSERETLTPNLDALVENESAACNGDTIRHPCGMTSRRRRVEAALAELAALKSSPAAPTPELLRAADALADAVVAACDDLFEADADALLAAVKAYRASARSTATGETERRKVLFARHDAAAAAVEALGLLVRNRDRKASVLEQVANARVSVDELYRAALVAPASDAGMDEAKARPH
jgi:hypothetical protein